MKKTILFASIFMSAISVAHADSEAMKNPNYYEQQEKIQRESLSKRFSEWIPNGWTLEEGAEGDLNKDGIADAVLVIRKQDPSLKKGDDGIDTNPGRLFILLRDGNGYRLAAEDRKNILSPKESTYHAIYLDIKNQVLSVGLATHRSMPKSSNTE